MAGVIGKRLRLTTSRKPSYRRGGVVIGNLNAPTYIEGDDVTLDHALAIVRDPNIAIALEDEEGAVSVLTEEEREAIAEGIETEIEVRRVEAGQPEPDLGASHGPWGEPNTPEPQGGEVAASAEASHGGGLDATAADSTASAGGAVTPEPTAQPVPPAPEPAAAPKPASRGGGKAKGTAA